MFTKLRLFLVISIKSKYHQTALIFTSISRTYEVILCQKTGYVNKLIFCNRQCQTPFILTPLFEALSTGLPQAASSHKTSGPSGESQGACMVGTSYLSRQAKLQLKWNPCTRIAVQVASAPTALIYCAKRLVNAELLDWRSWLWLPMESSKDDRETPVELEQVRYKSLLRRVQAAVNPACNFSIQFWENTNPAQRLLKFPWKP